MGFALIFLLFFFWERGYNEDKYVKEFRMTSNESIGLKLKRLRTDKHMTLKELSGLTNLSIGFLSQIENGKASVAIDTLSKIADVLEVTLPYLFSQYEDESSGIVTRSFDIAYKPQTPFCLRGSLVQNKELSRIQPNLLTLLPCGNQIPKPSCHPGEEFLYVIDGVIVLELDGVRENLYPGDSAHFNSAISHAYWNESRHISHVLSTQLCIPGVSENDSNREEG